MPEGVKITVTLTLLVSFVVAAFAAPSCGECHRPPRPSCAECHKGVSLHPGSATAGSFLAEARVSFNNGGGHYDRKGDGYRG
jgi:hypothetical protein